MPIKGIFKLEAIKDAHREYASSQGVGSIIIEVSQGEHFDFVQSPGDDRFIDGQ